MILASRAGRNVRTTFADLGIQARPPALNGAGVAATTTTAVGIPAVQQAVRIAAEAVAALEIGVYRGPLDQRERVTTVWQARLFAGPPCEFQTAYAFRELLEESLTYRNNAFVWKTSDPSTGRVVEMVGLHPDQVQVRVKNGRPIFMVSVGPGYFDPVGNGNGTYTVGPDVVLHIRGFGGAGRMLAPTPIELHREALGSALAKIAHEGSTYARGASIGLAVTYPESMNAQKARAWRELWQETYEGPQNAGKTAVLGGGATIQPIGLTMVDAQFVESMAMSVEEVARIFNVQASLLGAGRVADKPVTPEHEQDRWLRYGLGPRLSRIESAFAADPQLFGPGSRVYPMFASPAVRGDLLTEAEVSLKKVQSGQWTPDEARAKDGMPPLPGGIGAIPQIVPVGGAPNPVPTPAPDPPEE